ncbi:hypothetical protein HK098_001505 [Nowakowskiella sp. JEL0407]|nr:hypothetical protein HK098_001505 [Nowakowskiella sp. JEL0407]
MSDADLILAWKSPNNTTIISDRYGAGHQVPPTDNTQNVDLYDGPSFGHSQNTSWARFTVSFIKPLSSNSNEDKWIDISKPISYIFAFSAVSPYSNEVDSGNFTGHAPGDNGVFTFCFFWEDKYVYLQNSTNYTARTVSRRPSPSPTFQAVTLDVETTDSAVEPTQSESETEAVSVSGSTTKANPFVDPPVFKPSNSLLLIHAWIMVAAFLVFEILRYKPSVTTSEQNRLRVPIAILILSILSIIGSFFAISLYSSSPHFSKTTHHILGLVVILILTVHSILTIIAYKTKLAGFEIVMRMADWTVLLFASIQTALGIKMYFSSENSKFIAYLTFMCVFVVVILLFEIMLYRKRVRVGDLIIESMESQIDEKKSSVESTPILTPRQSPAIASLRHSSSPAMTPRLAPGYTSVRRSVEE